MCSNRQRFGEYFSLSFYLIYYRVTPKIFIVYKRWLKCKWIWNKCNYKIFNFDEFDEFNIFLIYFLFQNCLIFLGFSLLESVLLTKILWNYYKKHYYCNLLIFFFIFRLDAKMGKKQPLTFFVLLALVSSSTQLPGQIFCCPHETSIFDIFLWTADIWEAQIF